MEAGTAGRHAVAPLMPDISRIAAKCLGLKFTVTYSHLGLDLMSRFMGVVLASGLGSGNMVRKPGYVPQNPVFFGGWTQCKTPDFLTPLNFSLS